jgi:hypothetical protein
MNETEKHDSGDRSVKIVLGILAAVEFMGILAAITWWLLRQ